MRFEAQLDAFPAAGRALLAEVLDGDFRGVIPAASAAAIEQAVGADPMSLLVPFAQCYAIPPISGLTVGVVARGATGGLYLGANMEFEGTALSFSVHAEQSALTNAWLNGEEGLQAIAVSAAPCGYCRQFLYELEAAEGLAVIIDDDAFRLGDLLPGAFGPANLQQAARLMIPDDHGLRIDPSPGDPLVAAALAAASASYAPYTGGFAGIAIQTASGAVYTGRYAESAAYNSSMSPLESALTMRVLAGSAEDPLTRAVLVERRSRAGQAGATAEVLRVVAPALDLEIYVTA